MKIEKRRSQWKSMKEREKVEIKTWNDYRMKKMTYRNDNSRNLKEKVKEKSKWKNK